MEANKVYCMDNREGLKQLEDNSIDSIVTDPPYELTSKHGARSPQYGEGGKKRYGETVGGFMGMKWDATGIAFDPAFWKECLRVLKPGGHLLSFGGSRTYHRMACAIEDAGFEIRDCLMWIYGSGLPKSHDISKAIDKAAGAEREVGRLRTDGRGKWELKMNRKHGDTGVGHADGSKRVYYETAPATPEAKQWEGWGTALKPAHEPVILARKPISEKTIAANVLKWGTGGLNIDGCRIGTETIKTTGRRNGTGTSLEWSKYTSPDGFTGNTHEGRFPANIILDEEAAAMLDEQSGVLKSGYMKAGRKYGMGDGQNVYAKLQGTIKSDTYGDSGGASRFFYVAKASKKERGEGNNHPTVKPITLIRYLARLVTPPGGTVLDPFMGSGTTALACEAEGFSWIGFDLSPEYCAITERRLLTQKG